MRFTSKRGDVSDADSGGMYLRSFKTGATTVRFLQEMKDWDRYREHYTLDGKMFPCIKDMGNCPGCNSENDKVSKSSRKYATNVYLPQVGVVLPFKIPISLAKRLETRAERNGGTLLNRDYVIFRKGSGLDTDYDVEGDEKYEVDIDEKLKEATDVNECLDASFREQWGDPEDFVSDGKPAASKPSEDVPPTETSAQSESAGDEVISEDALWEMPRNDLEVVARKVGVDPGGMTDRQLVRKILATA